MGLWHNHHHNHKESRHSNKTIHYGRFGQHGYHHLFYPYHHYEATTTTVNNTVSTQVIEEEKSIQESIETSSETTETPITYLRSRNLDFDASSLKPFTLFTPFFSTTNVLDNITPKLLEIRMESGTFQVGETVETSNTYTSGKIIFRLCSPNHKEGPYNQATKEFSLNPYTRSEMEVQYSESSTILNVDTKSLGLPSETSFYGSVEVGMTLVGKTSGALATVTNVRLVSDRNGRLIGSFLIPNPNTIGNQKYNTGTNKFTLLDVDSFALVGQARSVAEGDYYSMGTEKVTQMTTTRPVNTIDTQTSVVSNTVNTVTTTTIKVPLTPKQRKLLVKDLGRIEDDLKTLSEVGNRFEGQWSRLANRLKYKIWKYQVIGSNLDIKSSPYTDLIALYESEKQKLTNYLENNSYNFKLDEI